ncbi:MAG: hypothetical protein R3359_11860, partial [Marinirhabdus sp.]|nr:hypothetical protein [Marinirhabdus sp.]
QVDFNEAEKEAEQSLKLLQYIGDRRSQAMILLHMSEIKFYRQAYETALALAYESLEIFRDLKIRLQIAIALYNMGHYYNRLQNKEKATDSWAEALQIAVELKNQNLINRLQENINLVKDERMTSNS